MKITLDIKTLVVGFLLGALFMCALAATGRRGDLVSFGIAVPSGGWAIVKTDKDRAYIVDKATGVAKAVKFVGKSDTKVY